MSVLTLSLMKLNTQGHISTSLHSLHELQIQQKPDTQIRS